MLLGEETCRRTGPVPDGAVSVKFVLLLVLPGCSDYLFSDGTNTLGFHAGSLLHLVELSALHLVIECFNFLSIKRAKIHFKPLC